MRTNLLRRRAFFEPLESRRVLAAAVDVTFEGGVLTILGSNKSDKILVDVVTDAAGSSSLSVTAGGETQSFSLAPTDPSDPSTAVTVDSIFVDAGNGNDWVRFGAGITADATIFGGNGNDRIFSGGGNDTIDAGMGNDRVRGGAGNDTIWLWQGNDWAWGEDGDDTIWADVGNDKIFGDVGNDTLWGWNGNDALNGGDGDDIMHGEDGHDRLKGGLGDDQLYGEGNKDHLRGEDGNDFLDGGDDTDLMWGDAGDDILVGGDGNDHLNGGEGVDFLDGGEGNNKLVGGEQTGLSATLDSATTDAAGSATLALDNADGTPEIELQITLSGLTADTDYNLLIGTTVIPFTTDLGGGATLLFSTDPDEVGEVAFPTGLVVTAGMVISVEGTDLTGTFA
jgi:Ca2+-binding RTX toxin-like protein